MEDKTRNTGEDIPTTEPVGEPKPKNPVPKKSKTGKLTITELADELEIRVRQLAGIFAHAGKVREFEEEYMKSREGKELKPIMTVAEFNKLKRDRIKS